MLLALSCISLSAQQRKGGDGQNQSQSQSGQSIVPMTVGRSLTLENTRSAKSMVRGGQMVVEEPIVMSAEDSLALKAFGIAALDSLTFEQLDSLIVDDESIRVLSVSAPPSQEVEEPSAPSSEALLISQSRSVIEANEEPIKSPYFSDSMSYRRVVGTSLFLPGFGQIYNKQAWKVPVIYGAIAGSSILLYHENQKYRPIKSEYEDYTYTTSTRSDYLDELQSDYIRSSRRRNTYIAMMAASSIYALGDAAVNYSTGEVSPIRKATTLSAICPGAGQVYNRSYWKLPFIVGGITTMVFVYDWNNRGYVRFSKAYEQVYAYETYPEDYPDGPFDEFGGRYTSAYMKSLRDSYKRNRDLSIIIAVGLYIFQIIDANVDAHLKDFDISHDLAVDVSPVLDYAYLPSSSGGGGSAIFGLNFGINF